MRKLTLVMKVYEETFEPKHILYIDDVKTNLGFNIENIMDTVSFHGIDVGEEVKKALIAELVENYKATDDEVIEFIRIIGERFEK